MHYIIIQKLTVKFTFGQKAVEKISAMRIPLK